MMGVNTGIQVRCQGCKAGAFVPLKQATRDSGEMGRFYMVHPMPSGCGAYYRYPTEIDNTDDLADMVPGIVLKGPGIEPALKEDAPLKGDPLKDDPLKDDPLKEPALREPGPNFGHEDIAEPDPEPITEPAKEPDEDVDQDKNGGADNGGYGLNDWNQ